MSDLTDRLDAIRARLDAATPGPWRWDEDYGSKGDEGLALTNDVGAEIVGAYNHHCCSFRDDPTVEDNDAEFIAAAPADVAFLLDLARKQGAALEDLIYVADNKAADNMIGRWWAGVIKGTIHSHMNPAPALEAKP